MSFPGAFLSSENNGRFIFTIEMHCLCHCCALHCRLRDESTPVRKNTLLVLAHLILNDMIKVKGQISEMASCVIDDNAQIAGHARIFFSDLAKRV